MLNPARAFRSTSRLLLLLPVLALMAAGAAVAGGPSSARAGIMCPPGFCTPQTTQITVVKTDAPDPVPTGTLLTYTITITNTGMTQASDVNLYDRLTVGALTGVMAVTTQGTCPSVSNDSVLCVIGVLAPAGTATVTITGTVAAATGRVIMNQATVRATVNGQRVEAQDIEYTTVGPNDD